MKYGDTNVKKRTIATFMLQKELGVEVEAQKAMELVIVMTLTLAGKWHLSTLKFESKFSRIVVKAKGAAESITLNLMTIFLAMYTYKFL